MARVLLIISMLLVSVESFSDMVDYDPFAIAVIPATAVRMGCLRYEEENIICFNRTQQRNIVLKLDTARKNNKMLLISSFPSQYQSVNQDSPQKLAATVEISSESPQDDWITLSYKNILFKSGGCFSKSSIKYQIGEQIKEVLLFQEEVEEYMYSVISTAQRNKKDITINTTALKSEIRQEYLRGQQIAFIAN